MARLTEYHNGVAVIKNKDFKAAAEKLARYEDEEEERNKDFEAIKKEFFAKRFRKVCGGSDE